MGLASPSAACVVLLCTGWWYTQDIKYKVKYGVGKPKCCHQQSRQPDILHSCFLSSIKALKQINLKFTSRSIQSLEKGKFERFVKTTLLMQNSKLMTTAYYRCTKMVVTKTVIGDNAMRMSHSLNWRLDGFGPLLPLFSIHLNPFCFPLILLEIDNLLFSSKFLRNIVKIII